MSPLIWRARTTWDTCGGEATPPLAQHEPRQRELAGFSLDFPSGGAGQSCGGSRAKPALIERSRVSEAVAARVSGRQNASSSPSAG